MSITIRVHLILVSETLSYPISIWFKSSPS
uniref:Uncharacterized protein n=1 Tax=Rhizophora mucronata TaxID=61149 RepID=A0A2P2QU45_RHIMU